MRDGAVSFAFGVTGAAAHVCKNGVIDAVVLAPAAHGVVPLVAFDKAILRLHEERLKREGLAGRELGDQHVLIVEQLAARAKHKFVRDGRWVDGRAEVYAEVLDGGL